MTRMRPMSRRACVVYAATVAFHGRHGGAIATGAARRAGAAARRFPRLRRVGGRRVADQELIAGRQGGRAACAGGPSGRSARYRGAAACAAASAAAADSADFCCAMGVGASGACGLGAPCCGRGGRVSSPAVFRAAAACAVRRVAAAPWTAPSPPSRSRWGPPARAARQRARRKPHPWPCFPTRGPAAPRHRHATQPRRPRSLAAFHPPGAAPCVPPAAGRCPSSWALRRRTLRAAAPPPPAPPSAPAWHRLRRQQPRHAAGGAGRSAQQRKARKRTRLLRLLRRRLLLRRHVGRLHAAPCAAWNACLGRLTDRERAWSGRGDDLRARDDGVKMS